MGKINQKQNGSGVTFGSGRSYLCLEERIEWEGVGGSENKEEEKKREKRKLSIFPKFGLLFLHAEALLTWTVWMSFVKSCCIFQGHRYSVAPRTRRGSATWTWWLIARSTVRHFIFSKHEVSNNCLSLIWFRICGIYFPKRIHLLLLEFKKTDYYIVVPWNIYPL